MDGGDDEEEEFIQVDERKMVDKTNKNNSSWITFDGGSVIVDEVEANG